MHKLKAGGCSNGNIKLNFNDGSDNYCGFVHEKEKCNKINTSRNSLLKVKLSQVYLEKISVSDEERMADDNRSKKTDQAKNCSVTKLSVPQISKETKSKYGVSLPGKSASYNRNSKHPLPKKKFIPVANHITNTSAKIVLFERNVQIKDLESKVRYLQSKIKELEVENKTLHDVQSRQERELKKFKEGVADIPSLLRSHKEETRLLESTIFALRNELKDCQKELKTKNEVILKKDHQIDKQNSSLKRNKKIVQDISSEIQNLKIMKLELEEGNKKLLESNQSLKFENEDLQKKIKEMMDKNFKLEENLCEEKNLNKQLTDEIEVLQRKYKDKQHNDSCAHQILMFDKETSYNPLIETSPESLNPLSFETSLESENKKLEESSVIHELWDKTPEKAKNVDKTKEALIHTVKRYEEICNGQSYRSAGKLSVGIMTKNVKSLPPLKQTMRRYSQNENSMFIKEQFFSSGDANLKVKEGNKSLGSKELFTYFHRRLKNNDTERASGNGRNFTVKFDKYNTFDESPKQSSLYQ